MAIDFDATGVLFDSPLFTFDGENNVPTAGSDNINDAARLYFISHGGAADLSYNDNAKAHYAVAGAALNDAARQFWMVSTGSSGQSYNDAGLKYFNDQLVLAGGAFNDRAIQFYNN